MQDIKAMRQWRLVLAFWNITEARQGVVESSLQGAQGRLLCKVLRRNLSGHDGDQSMLECQNHRTSAEESCGHKVKLAQVRSCICHSRGAQRAARWYLALWWCHYACQMVGTEVQDLLFALLCFDLPWPIFVQSPHPSPFGLRIFTLCWSIVQVYDLFLILQGLIGERLACISWDFWAVLGLLNSIETSETGIDVFALWNCYEPMRPRAECWPWCKRKLFPIIPWIWTLGPQDGGSAC